MHAIRMEIEASPEWANARERPECERLCQEAQLLEQLWSLMLEGFQAANFGEAPSGIMDKNERTLHFADKAAGKVISSLGGHFKRRVLPPATPRRPASGRQFKRPVARPMLPDHSKLWEGENKPSMAFDCVEAWQEALKHLKETTKWRNRKPDVWAALDRLAQDEPTLYGRLRVSVAIGNAGAKELPAADKQRLNQIRARITAESRAWIESDEPLKDFEKMKESLKALEKMKKPLDAEVDRLGKAAVNGAIIDGSPKPLNRAFKVATWALGFPAKHLYDEAKRRANSENLPKFTIMHGPPKLT